MKQLITKSVGLAIGVALVAPLLMAPAAVNGSLGGFSSNAQGGQNPSDWGIPQNSSNQNSSSQNSSNQNSSNQNGSNQNSSSQGHSNQNSQSGDGQSGPAEGQAKSGDGSGQSGPGEGQAKSGDGGGQSGPGEGQAKSGDGGNQNGNGGNQNSDGGNQNGAGEGQTKSGDGGNQNNSGSAEGEGPMLNPMGGSIRPDDPRLGGNHDGGNSGGHGSGSGSHGAHSGQGGPGDYPPLDPPNDGQYDPSNNNGEQQVPSGCAEAGSMCAQCVQRNESVVQFNRRYLHVAWSTTHQAIEYANKAIAFGDAASGIHSTQALAWQLAGKPQITEALTSIRRTYDNKYHIYINNMEEALNALNQCEQDNFAVRDLYARFSSLYLEFVKARYQSPD